MKRGHLLLERVKTELLLLDGAMGTEIQKRGLRGNTALKNVEAPEAVEEIHRAYLEAGADILETNTFAGARYALSRDDVATPKEELVREYNLAGVCLARKVAGDSTDVFIAGSIGPLGKMVAPARRRRVSSELYVMPEEAYSLFKEQAEALKEGGVDFVLIETMIDLSEAMLALRAVKDTGLIAGVSLNFDEDIRTPFGNSVEECMRECEEGGADLIGTNCSSGVLPAIKVTGELNKFTSRPIMVYPNAGKPDARGVYPDSPAYMAGYVHELIEAGANIIGGCCGTTPAHIEAFRAVIDRFGGKRT